MENKTHNCLHEEQIMGQSRAIERLGAELDYKKERLDDLKADNKRMEEKIDGLSKDITDFIQQSDKKDSQLDNRLTSIETRLDTQERLTTNNRSDANVKISLMGVVVAIVAIAVPLLFKG